MENVKSALIFASGKVVFTGAKTKDDIDKAYYELKRKMEKFKKDTWFLYAVKSIISLLARDKPNFALIESNHKARAVLEQDLWLDKGISGLETIVSWVPLYLKIYFFFLLLFDDLNWDYPERLVPVQNVAVVLGGFIGTGPYFDIIYLFGCEIVLLIIFPGKLVVLDEVFEVGNIFFFFPGARLDVPV